MKKMIGTALTLVALKPIVDVSKQYFKSFKNLKVY